MRPAPWRSPTKGSPTRAPPMSVGCRPAGGCLTPGSVVHVEVTAQVPLPLLPPVFGHQPPSIRVEAEHTVPYGTFREDRS